MQFDHIGIFVKTLNQGRIKLKEMLPIVSVSEVYHDPLLKVSVQFLNDSSGICYEIVAPNGEGNPVDSVLIAKRNILNHVAYKVVNFEASIERLRQAHCIPLGKPQPAIAFGGARVVFLLTPLRMIVELIEIES
jgi:methylmalonyl-CoA/ethylmalonyl-CoA epimerase